MDLEIDAGLRIPARDGFLLAATLYEPPAATDVVVLVNSATAVKRGYYDAFARFLAGEGFTVLTYDYRGIGGSRPRRLGRFPARMRQWGDEDQAGVVDWIAAHLRPRKLLVVGHSVGGQIVGLAPNHDRIAAALAVAAQSAYWRLWPAPYRYLMALRWYLLLPAVSWLVGYVPGWMGTKEDLPGGVARQWAAWGRRPGYLVDGDEEVRHRFERFAKPILAYSFADDHYAPRAAVEGLLRAYRNARVTHRHLHPEEVGEPIGHFGFFRARFRETLWREVAGWLVAQSAAAESAA